jgi:hypothetical protein
MILQESAIQNRTYMVAHILNTQKCQPVRPLQATSLSGAKIKIVLVIRTMINRRIDAILHLRAVYLSEIETCHIHI